MDTMTIIRKPIIMRVPIMLNAEIYHIIAAHNPKYEDAYLVGTYSGSIDVARHAYGDAMNEWHQKNPGLWCFAIIPHSNFKRCVRKSDWPDDMLKEEVKGA